MKKIILAVLAIGLGSSAFAWTRSEAYESLGSFNVKLKNIAYETITMIRDNLDGGKTTRLMVLDQCKSFLETLEDIDAQFKKNYTSPLILNAKTLMQQNVSWISAALSVPTTFKSTLHFTKQYVYNTCLESSKEAVDNNEKLQDYEASMNLSMSVLDGIQRELELK